MKKLKSVLSVFFAAAICCMLGGCSVFDVFSVDSLIRAPKITGDNAEIQQCFEAAVGKNVSLLSPVSGEYKSSFVFFDFDKDLTEEVIVFYAKNEEPDVARVHFLDSQNGRWVSVTDIKGNGSEVYSVEFSNMGASSAYELAVAWTVADSKRVKTLSIYKYDQNTVTGECSFLSLATVQVTDYFFIDMDSDDSNELFYTFRSSTEATPGVFARLLRLSDDAAELYPVSEISLNPEITSFYSYSYEEKIDKYYIYIDCELSSGRYNTEIIVFDNAASAFSIATDKDGNEISAKTIRFSQLNTVDLKNDHSLEVPYQYTYEHSYVLNAAEDASDTVYITEYFRLENDELTSVVKYFVNEEFAYRIVVDGLCDNMYIVYDKSTGVVQFRLTELPEDENLVFSLQYRVNSDELNTSFYVNITSLGESMHLNRSVITNLIEVI